MEVHFTLLFDIKRRLWVGGATFLFDSIDCGWSYVITPPLRLTEGDIAICSVWLSICMYFHPSVTFFSLKTKVVILIRFFSNLDCGIIITIIWMSSNFNVFREYLNRLLAPDWSKFMKYVNCSKIFSF